MILLLWACVSPDSFQDRYAAAMCNRYAECFEDSYAERFPDADTCEQTWLDRSGDAACLSVCEFNSSAASSCLYAVSVDTCDEVFSTGVSECFGVYDCSGAAYTDCLLEG